MGRSWETIYRHALHYGAVSALDKPEYQMLRRKAHRGTLTKLQHNLYVLNEKWDQQDPYQRTHGLVRALATHKYPQQKIYCVVTAAILWGFDVPFRLLYRVLPEMLERDRAIGIYSDTIGYSVNPTVFSAHSRLQRGIFVNTSGDPLDGHYTYVVSKSGALLIAKRNGNGRDGKPTPHPTLIGGTDPQVRVAGTVTISRGKIVKYDVESGHFKPNIKSLVFATEAFSQLPATAFHRRFRKHMNGR